MIFGKGKYVFHRGEEKQRSLDTWSVEGGTGQYLEVWGGTGWYFVALGQYRMVLVDI